MTPPSSDSPPPGSPQSVPFRPQQGRGIAAAVLSTVGVLAVAIVVLVVVMVQGASLPSMPQLPVAAGEEAESSPSASPKPEPMELVTPSADDPEALTSPIVAGWKGVAVEDRGVAYDVPGTWFVESPGMVTGFGDSEDSSVSVGMGGTAVYGQRMGPCYTLPPNPARTGISAFGEVVDTAEYAPKVAKAWGTQAYLNESGKPEVTVSEATPFAANGLSGHQATAEVQVAAHDCYPEQAMVRVVSFLSPAGDDVFNFVIYSDTAGEAAPDTSRFDSIVASLRPLY